MVQEPRRAAAGVLAALTALLLAAPTPQVALTTLGSTGAVADPTSPLVALVALLAWLVSGWLALTVAVVLVSRLPGLLGRTAGALAARVAPSAVRRSVEAALGLTVAVGALVPTSALAAPLDGPPVTAGVEVAWDLDWPSSPPPAASARPSARAATTPPAAATAPPPSATTTTPGGSVRPSPAAARPSPAAPRAGAVVVRAGDSLWSLAEASLRSAGTAAPTDGQVALAWPRWWAANREVVGDDPDLLRPGTVLRPPSGP